jgi:hypothetical protein
VAHAGLFQQLAVSKVQTLLHLEFSLHFLSSSWLIVILKILAVEVVILSLPLNTYNLISLKLKVNIHTQLLMVFANTMELPILESMSLTGQPLFQETLSR